jgi:Flp pilus assembly protein TadG
MKRQTASFIAFIRRFRAGQAGVADVFFVLFLTAMVGFMGLVMDFGRAYQVQQALQASTDASALAGAYYISKGTEVASANTYSGLSGDQNATPNSGATVTMVSGYPKTYCSTTFETAVPCVGSPAVNAIQVEQQAVVPTYFTQVFGVSSVTVKVLSTAIAKGGQGGPLNVMILLDTSGSMNNNDPACGASRETCALAGISVLLQKLNPETDYIGLMVFPGVASTADAADDTTCGKTLPASDITTYSDTPVYGVVATPVNKYSSGGTIQTSSPLAIATGNGGCSKGGVTAIGGEGTYYAQAISQAQTELVAFAATQPTPAQNVIILVSDGGAAPPQTGVPTTAESDFSAYIDNGTVGTAGTTMTVSGCCTSGSSGNGSSDVEGPLAANQVLTGLTGSSTTVAAGTTIVKQLTGTTGGNGTYQVSISQAVGTSGFFGQAGSIAATNVVSIDGTNFDENTDECQQGIAAAQAAAAAGTWIYTIAYGSENETGGSSTCTTDSTATAFGKAFLSSCTTMQDMASAPAPDFFSDGSNGEICTGATSTGDLPTLFAELALQLTEPRLVPNNTA